MEHEHPQRTELERRIAWFLAHPQHDCCVVVEPDSQSIVRLRIPLKSMRGHRSEKLGRIMEVELTPDEVARGGDVALLKIGFKEAGQRKATFEGERNQIFPSFERPAMKAKVTAGEVLRVMQEVFEIGDAWLWTFHVDDPNQWPDPLPKPSPWPPARMESPA